MKGLEFLNFGVKVWIFEGDLVCFFSDIGNGFEKGRLGLGLGKFCSFVFFGIVEGFMFGI